MESGQEGAGGGGETMTVAIASCTVQLFFT